MAYFSCESYHFGGNEDPGGGLITQGYRLSHFHHLVPLRWSYLARIDASIYAYSFRSRTRPLGKRTNLLHLAPKGGLRSDELELLLGCQLPGLSFFFLLAYLRLGWEREKTGLPCHLDSDSPARLLRPLRDPIPRQALTGYTYISY